MSPRATGVWWLAPAGAMGLVVPVTLLLAASYDDSQYRQYWNTPKYLTMPAVAWLALGAALFAVGSLWPLLLRSSTTTAGVWPAVGARELTRLKTASSVIFWLTIVGYVVMAAAGVVRGARPSDLVLVLTSQDNYGSELRANFAPITGVTTLTQLGIAYVIIGLVILSRTWDRKVARRVALLLLLALLRTFFLSERLATLELVIPAVAVVAFAIAHRTPGIRHLLIQGAPLALVPTSIAIFGAFEYSRSWVFYAEQRRQGFAEFVLNRLTGYYCTAYNNGQLLLTAMQGEPTLPYQSIEAVWTAPGMSQLDLYSRLTGRVEPEDSLILLRQLANPEFNSPGGLSMPFSDYGMLGGLLFFLIAGSLIGLAYREYRDGAMWALLVYPTLVTGLFEMPRYLYWGTGRVLPAVVSLLLVAWWVRRQPSLAASRDTPAVHAG